MYQTNSTQTRNSWARPVCIRSAPWSLALAALSVVAVALPAPAQDPSSVIREISKANDRLEMTVNTSRILTLEKRIPRLVVTNPDLVSATPVSENQVQVAARKPGVTQINLWDEDGKVYSVDIMIFGDVRELDMMLKRMYPESSIKLVRLSQSLVLEGQVDRPEVVSTIRTLAEDYAPKIVNNMTVGGVQQILLKVKIMEVSRTKLRSLGFDFSYVSASGGGFSSGASGLLDAGTALLNGTAQTGTGETMAFGVVDGGDSFFGLLEALEQNTLAKTIANPTLVAISGRSARFHVGGEAFFSIGNGINGNSIRSEEFGTTVSFVPIVMGNGMIRIEVRPQISEIDNTSKINGALFTTKNSEVDTGVELAAGQTLALAGLVQTRVNSQKRGVPYLSNIPYLGVPFRSVRETVEEIELLIMVTPEFADGMTPDQVPQCGPGMESVSPTRCELYGKGLIEVPSCGPCGVAVNNYHGGGAGGACINGACATGNCATGNCGAGQPGSASGGNLPTDAFWNANDPSGQMLDGASYGYVQQGLTPTPADAPSMTEEAGQPSDSGAEGQPGQSPAGEELQLQKSPNAPGNSGDALPDPTAVRYRSPWNSQQAAQRSRPQNPQYRTARQPAATRPPTARTTSTPGLIGPLGYDVEK